MPYEEIFRNEYYMVRVDWEWEELEICDAELYGDIDNSIDLDFEVLDKFIHVLQQIKEKIEEKKNA